MNPDESPLFQNWRALRESIARDTIILFRLGDFYEAFEDDAKTLARVCNVALTKRVTVPMSGIPHHSAVRCYIPKLLEARFKVAIAEPEGDYDAIMNQVRKGTLRTEYVKRVVVEIIKPKRIVRDRD